MRILLEKEKEEEVEREAQCKILPEDLVWTELKLFSKPHGLKNTSGMLDDAPPQKLLAMAEPLGVESLYSLYHRRD